MTIAKNQRYVISTAPESTEEPNSFLAHDGTTTTQRSHAAKFLTGTDAMKFAEQHAAKLPGITRIGIEDFTDVELSVDAGLQGL